jgi:hypothetical protein
MGDRLAYTIEVFLELVPLDLPGDLLLIPLEVPELGRRKLHQPVPPALE